MTINPSGRLFTQKMEQLVDYVKWKNLSVETEQKLFTYYETKYRGNEMNESLRAVRTSWFKVNH
ncbi:hypothetical protein BCR33DRAFT_717264 [Rhizoclosmatium globosum]|uniref:Uncharacterized protein n=1 Tax=Rhizoclosmatium globosum TaxID=329046 RepID=A0A1Y2CAX4_9FUNG|nr:hypothetical protein BCR33DRAFT_717264 [Rhizoclosmatium globosum]|eukprot:ORY44188.1 hypothetical protein BCR33DRAFT_717264 [Rhizoclosmatium globosum]